MIMRLVAGVALATFGYWVGKQVGRNEHIRDELAGHDDGTARQTGEIMDEQECREQRRGE